MQVFYTEDQYLNLLDDYDRKFREALTKEDWPFSIAQSEQWVRLEAPKEKGSGKTLEQLAKEFPVKWLFEDLGTTSSLGGIYADSGVGKTFFAIAVALSVVSGRDLIPGFRVKTKGQVIFMLAEGLSGFDQRVRAACSYFKLDYDSIKRDILVIPYMVPMQRGEGSAIKKIEPELRSKQSSTTLVIFDNYSHFHSVADTEENSIEDNNRLIKDIRGFLSKLRCAGITIHHANKAAGEIRGGGSIKANLEYLIKLSKRGDMIESFVEKCRDGVDGGKQAFEIVEVEDSAVITPSSRPLPQATRSFRRGVTSPKKNREDLGDRILSELTDEPLTCNKLAGALSEKHEVISAALRKLVREGELVESKRGSWSVYSRPNER